MAAEFTIQTPDYTVLSTPAHMRAGEAIRHPVALLTGRQEVVEIRLAPADARALAAFLVAAADFADASTSAGEAR